ncbi:MAG: hypothetical protein JSS10_09630 [Verrucomicrobia bacterium]|nr:hypothetical protein [Verrucomicrobiota bacterium]
MSDPIQVFYQMRDTFLLIPSNWVQYQEGKVALLDKKEAWSSLSPFRRLQHTFGYGAWGYHTLNDAVEKVAHAVIREMEESVVDHLRSLEGEKIDGLSSESPEKTINLDIVLQTLDSIDNFKTAQRDLLQAIHAKFFDHNSILSKCWLFATILLRKVGRIFQQELLFRLKQTCGLGPLGYHRFQAMIVHVSTRCMEDLSKSVLESLVKIKEGKIEELSEAETGYVIEAMDKIDAIRMIQQELIQKAWVHFSVRANTLSRWCLRTVSFLKSWAPLKWNSFHYISLESLERLRSEAHQKVLSIFLEQLKPLQKPILLWEGKKDSRRFKLFLITSRSSQQLQFFQNDQYRSHVVFCQDQKQGKIFLSILNYEFKDKEAQNFLLYFLQKLAVETHVNEIRWYEKELETPLEKPTYSEGKLSEALQPMEILLEEAQKKGVFTNLIPMRYFLTALESFGKRASSPDAPAA